MPLDDGWEPIAPNDGWEPIAPAPAPRRQRMPLAPRLQPRAEPGGIGGFVGAAAENLIPEALRQPSMFAEVPGAVSDLIAAGQDPGTAAAVQFGKDVVGASSAASQEQFEKGNTLGGIGAAVPVIGPAAAQAGEEIGNGEYARGLGHAAGLLAPSLLGEAGRVAPKLRAWSRENYVRAMAPRGLAAEKVANAVAPGLADRRVQALTRRGLQGQAQEGAANASAALDDQLAQVPGGRPVDLPAAADRLDTAAQAFTVPAKGGGPAVVVDPTAVEHLDRLRDLIDSTEPTFEPARKLRQILDGQVVAGKKAFGRTVAEGTQMDATRQAANAVREQLARAEPTVADANRELSFWKNADDLLTAAVERDASRSGSLGEHIAEGAGLAGKLAAGGPVGQAIAVGQGARLGKQFMGSTLKRTVVGANQAAAADILASGAGQAALPPAVRLANALRSRDLAAARGITGQKTAQDASGASGAAGSASPISPVNPGGGQPGKKRVVVRGTGEVGVLEGFEPGPKGRVARIRVGGAIRRVPANQIQEPGAP